MVHFSKIEKDVMNESYFIFNILLNFPAWNKISDFKSILESLSL